MTRMRTAVVGAFVLGGLLLFGGGLFLIGDRRLLFVDQFELNSTQSGVLEGKDRTVLRIWIDATVLFTRDPDGTDRLTAAGRRRLDSAMADLVRYPRASPLVVEGYADAGDGEAPYLLSVDRAQIVRDYLLGRFRRQTTLTDIMPLSDEAPGGARASPLFLPTSSARRTRASRP